MQVIADRTAPCGPSASASARSSAGTRRSIEEAPSPLVERVDGMRERLFDAAAARSRSIGYAGAGTVEFLADGEGRFYFLEMNTRLQVEHPVTECTTGLDLVALQLHVAEGGRLDPDRRRRRGHAIEVRLYAEDPARDWQPQSGALHRFEVPGVSAEFVAGTGQAGRAARQRRPRRLGSRLHYDPMLAKVIAWAPHATRRRPCSLTRSPGRASTAWPPTATCWSTCCATRRSSAGGRTPDSSRGTTSKSWPNPSPTSAATKVTALAAALR